MINVAWVARDGYLKLLPPVIKKIRTEEEGFNHIVLCHTEREKNILITEHGLENIILISNEIKTIKKNVDYSADRLKVWAKKYNNMPLIRCLWSTMFEVNHSENEINKEAASQFEFWEKFLVENNIDVLLYERPSLMSTCIAWIICQRRHILSVDFIDLAINTMTITTSWNGDYATEVKDKLGTELIDKNSESYKKAIAYVDLMKNKPQKPREAELAIKLTKERTKINLRKFFGSYKRHSIRKQNFSCRHKTYSSYVLSTLIYSIRSVTHKFVNVFEKNINPTEDKYFLYPLLSVGEVSNHSFMGLGYGDQVTVIREIAHCLPPWCVLYVKEHASMYSDHSFGFYREIKKIRRVKLISPHEDTFALIRNSEGICTLGSTMGFEAFLAGIPVLLFGEPWYRLFPGIHKVDTVETLAEYLQNIEQLKRATEEEKINTLYALYKISFEGVKWPQPNTTSPENITNMAEGLLKFIKTQKIKEASLRYIPKHSIEQVQSNLV